MICLNSPLLLVPTVTLGRCKAWIKNMMAIHGARLTINIKNDFNLTFRRIHYLDHLQCRNDDCNLFLLSKCRIEIVNIDDCVHDLQGGHFALNPPFCKIYNNAPFYLNMCATCMYYVMHK